MVFGLLLLGFLTYLFHNLGLSTATATVTVWVMLRGVVMPLANMPAQTAAMVDLPPEMIGRASALTNIIGRVSSWFLTTVLNNRQVFHWRQIGRRKRRKRGGHERPGTIGAAMGGGATSHRAGLALLQGMVSQTGFVNAIDDVFIITAP